MSKILLTGATGYVGGTVLSQLLNSTESSLKFLTIDLLVRHESQAQKLRDVYGGRVKPVLWTGLGDVEFIEKTAAQYDIIVNVGSGFIPAGAKAFVDGLAHRVKAGLPTPWLLHVSGCTNLAVSEQPHEWNDERDGQAIFDHMKSLDDAEPYSQRTAEVTVLESAAKCGVQAVSLQGACIFGEGTGLFNQQGLIIPLIMRYVVQHGHGFKLNDKANFDWVHVVDMADYYVLLVRNILERSDRGVGYIPSGKSGVLFPTAGRALVTEINQKAVNAAFNAGLLPRDDTPQQREVRFVPLQELADELMAGRCDIAQRGWGGEKAARGTLGQKLLGWEPKRLQKAWEQVFDDEVIALREGRRELTTESCIGVTVKSA